MHPVTVLPRTSPLDALADERDAFLAAAQECRAAHDRVAGQLQRAIHILVAMLTHAPNGSIVHRQAVAFLREVA